ncbi:hypothetical protein CE91St56_11700 [Lachnospiraceae bacterium]|nr:hypothetical protein CE91St56_11700 [Lachnospiraceae bacterium]GKH40110.1 hypothetical protein CE91St57_10840 [Lachnospiraceae bacterium]
MYGRQDCRQGKSSRGEAVPVESDTPQQAIGDRVYAPLRPGYFHAWFCPADRAWEFTEITEKENGKGKKL